MTWCLFWSPRSLIVELFFSPYLDCFLLVFLLLKQKLYRQKLLLCYVSLCSFFFFLRVTDHIMFSCQFKRTLGQFTPAQWDKDEWHPLLGPWRFIQVLTLCIIFLTVELNTFFLKFCLWVPPRNPVIIYRLILWWLIAIPTIREYNSYLQDR